MIIVGSQAMQHHFPDAGIVPKDTDIIGTMDEFRVWSREFAKGEIILCKPLSATKIHVRTKDGWNYEWEVAEAGNSAYDLWMYENEGYADPETLLFLKLSHRYRRNSPHHVKTIRDIQFLRAQGVELSTYLQQLLPKREAETYAYSHPKLDVSKGAFFEGDGIQYEYDHDDLHRIVAIDGAPAYTHYLKDGSEVLTCNTKFFSVDERIRLLGGLEESLVLAAERSLIPFEFKTTPEEAFKMALIKVTSSITSGKFREFCWENFFKIVDMYWELDGGAYAVKVKDAIDKGEIKKHEVK